MAKLSRILVLAVALIGMLGIAAAAEDLVKQNHPARYVVKKGDTLWDIAELFLHDPWRWSDIWYVNPQVKNPHLIYPGDVLELTYVNGKPQLRVVEAGPRVVKLSPSVRVTPWDGAIPTVPIDAIAPFLSRPYVVGEGELDAAPYVVDFADEHIMGGSGMRAYVRSIDSAEPEKFDLVRPGGPYKDAESGEVLGYEALFVGSALLKRTGDPATVFITNTEQEVTVGDRLLPVTGDKALSDFYPRPPKGQVQGAIIDVLNGVSQIGQFNVVVLDRGAADGLEPGTVLRVDQRGETIRDPVAEDRSTSVTLPDETAGLVMVFRTFERISFALVMEAERPMHVLDRVRNP
jgi:hypothetical protein